ncbi:hypothetical protein L1987_25318 [Smallanthus sonchifolius]|uniref:Uncharacterized protein n=1 Tax=Smallanthus sonchifolius TaxID=185202 RepID=A0ACB9ING0_9ASTR|nr:hypothetical protein L1987_25318 [Smallanthus sonchifolius]
MGRAPCCDKANVKKGPWTPEEDEQLKDYIQTHGTGGNWITLPQKAGLRRCGKSCRLRWMNYLRPNIKHGEFSDDEDKVICTLFASIGSRWSIMAAQLPGRTDNDIKNYWNTKLKKKMMNTLISMPEIRKPLHHLQSPNSLTNYSYPSQPYFTNTSSYHDQALTIPSSPITTAAAAAAASDHHHHHRYGGYVDSSLDSSLEEIKQLISTNLCTSTVDNNLNFFVDDTKEVENVMYY